MYVWELGTMSFVYGCAAIWQWRKSRDEKSRFFYAYHLHSLSSRSFTRSFKKNHSGGGFFWRGFLVVLRKLLCKFANLEKPRFLLASVNGPHISFLRLCLIWWRLNKKNKKIDVCLVWYVQLDQQQPRTTNVYKFVLSLSRKLWLNIINE